MDVSDVLAIYMRNEIDIYVSSEKKLYLYGKHIRISLLLIRR